MRAVPNTELSRRNSGADDASERRSTRVKTTNRLAATSFGLGVLSAFAFQIVILPISALVTGIIALNGFNRETQTGRWMAITGVVLGGLYGLRGSLWLLGI